MARVAALQFASTTDVAQNLDTCLRVIDRAARAQPQLMVLPEFCNHISWYDDAQHAWDVSLEPEGEFLKQIAARAERHQCYIVINVSLRQQDKTLTVSSVCFDPDGNRVAIADKQTLMGHENFWFSRAQSNSDIIETPFGRLGMFPCRDGVTCETPRGLALRGAQLFCDSLNSFALDEASLHVPARAPENKVFLVAANKVGPLIPEHLLTSVSEETHIPLRFLNGAGESQIVSPAGEILARAPAQGEAVISADIELSQADEKRRPDGSNIFAIRRPELYGVIAEPVPAPICGRAASEVSVACLAPIHTGEQALDELPEIVASLSTDTKLAVLPELFCYDEQVGIDASTDLAMGERAVAAMQQACAHHPELTLCASLVMPVADGRGIVSVLVGHQGLVAKQPQLHASARYPWARLGNSLELVDLPWARIALITGDDTCVPELVKVAALNGAHLMATSLDLQEPWEEAFGLRSRAAENRICVVASSRPLQGRAGIIASLEREFTLMTPWKERVFDGYINSPLVTPQEPGKTVTLAQIHPMASCEKLMSERTDLLLDRPWHLSSGLLKAVEEKNSV